MWVEQAQTYSGLHGFAKTYLFSLDSKSHIYSEKKYRNIYPGSLLPALFFLEVFVEQNKIEIIKCIEGFKKLKFKLK